MTAFTHEEIERILKNIRSQNMMAQFVEKKEDVLPAVKALLKEGDVVCNGGSMTLGQTGVLEMLKTSPAYEYLDISGDKTEEEKEELLRRRFTADVLLASANAILKTGEIYQVDGISTRVAPMLFGPKSVIIVAGVNKLVDDLPAAVARVRETVAPIIAARMAPDAPCAKLGHCVAVGKEIGKGCMCDARRCCNTVIMGRQRIKDRVKVILVGEDLGM